MNGDNSVFFGIANKYCILDFFVDYNGYSFNSKEFLLTVVDIMIQFSSVQSLSRVQLFVTPWIAACRTPYPSPIPSVYPNTCPLSWWCHPVISRLSSSSPAAFSFSQQQGLFQWVSSTHQVGKYWSLSFNISSSNEHPGLISFRMDWLDLLAVQGTPKSLLQHHSSKAKILQHSAFSKVQLSQPYMSTGKTIAWTRRTFVGKVMSLLLNMLSRLA